MLYSLALYTKYGLFYRFVFDLFRLHCRSLGLTKAELLKFVDDPWWMAVRRYSFISFWIVLLAIFTAACIIAIISTEQHCDMDKSTIHPINNSISANDSSPIKDLVSISRKFP